MKPAPSDQPETVVGQYADAEIAMRIGIALASQRRSAWRRVRTEVRNGGVTLQGMVPTFYDRQLVVTLTRHVAGVLLVDDQLAVDGVPQQRPATNINETASDSDPGEQKTHDWQLRYRDIDEVTESLEEVLARQSVPSHDGN